VKELVAKGADTEVEDAVGATPLHHAANNGKLAVVKALVAL
jgi:ankyrin repeat protein